MDLTLVYQFGKQRKHNDTFLTNMTHTKEVKLTQTKNLSFSDCPRMEEQDDNESKKGEMQQDVQKVMEMS